MPPHTHTHMRERERGRGKNLETNRNRDGRNLTLQPGPQLRHPQIALTGYHQETAATLPV